MTTCIHGKTYDECDTCMYAKSARERNDLRAQLAACKYDLDTIATIRRLISESDDIYLGDPGDVIDAVKTMLNDYIACKRKSEERKAALYGIISAMGWRFDTPLALPDRIAARIKKALEDE